MQRNADGVDFSTKKIHVEKLIQSNPCLNMGKEIFDKTTENFSSKLIFLSSTKKPSGWAKNWFAHVSK